MPFIHVRSLTEDEPADVTAALAALCADAADASGVEPRHFTASWETLAPAALVAGADGRPPVVLVDVLLPDLHPPERVAALLPAIAASLSKATGADLARVFVNARYARSGMVFDDGQVLRW